MVAKSQTRRTDGQRDRRSTRMQVMMEYIDFRRPPHAIQAINLRTLEALSDSYFFFDGRVGATLVSRLLAISSIISNVFQLTLDIE